MPPQIYSAGARTWAIALPLLLAGIILSGCFAPKKNNAAESPLWNVQAQSAGNRQASQGGAGQNAGATIESGQSLEVFTPESREPIVLAARAGIRPGEVIINLINQTNREINVLPQYFALINPDSGRRAIRPFSPANDQAFQAESKLAPENQLSLKIEFGNFTKRLTGWRLVFNPEPEGIPPTFASIK